jgi:hypothetical protein
VDQARAVERRAREADACEQVALERGVSSMETQGIDTCTLAAIFHRLFPEPAMKVQPGCSGKRPGSTQAGDRTAQQVEPDNALVAGPAGIHAPGSSEVMSLATVSDHVAATAPAGTAKAEPAGAIDYPSQTQTQTQTQTQAQADASIESRDTRAQGTIEDGLSGGVSAGTTASRFEMTQVEPAHERQTVLTQFPQEGSVSAKDADTLRLTYHFRSWQGQPVAMVSFNLHEAGRRLRVEAPDRGVYAALLTHRDGLSGTVRIVDGEPHSRERDGRRPEEGE